MSLGIPGNSVVANLLMRWPLLGTIVVAIIGGIAMLKPDTAPAIVTPIVPPAAIAPLIIPPIVEPIVPPPPVPASAPIKKKKG